MDDDIYFGGGFVVGLIICILFSQHVYYWANDLQPEEVRLEISDEMERLASENGIQIIPVGDYSFAGSLLSSRNDHIPIYDPKTFIGIASATNSTVFRYSEANAFSVVKKYTFSSEQRNYEYIYECYPDYSMVGYYIEDIKGSQVTFKTEMLWIYFIYIITLIIDAAIIFFCLLFAAGLSLNASEKK